MAHSTCNHAYNTEQEMHVILLIIGAIVWIANLFMIGVISGVTVIGLAMWIAFLTLACLALWRK